MDSEEDAGWELRVPQWRGLGLTDPIKAVEVSVVFSCFALPVDKFVGQMAAASSVS